MKCSRQATGKAAMQAFHAQGGAIDLLVTDVAMAPMNGCELGENLLKARPDLRVVFVSGYAGTAAFRYRYGLTGTFAYLRKPFKLDDLRAEVAAVAMALGQDPSPRPRLRVVRLKVLTASYGIADAKVDPLEGMCCNYGGRRLVG